jgi:peptide/nickel transport system ATP-binding protein
MTALVDLRRVNRVFTRKLDLAAKILNLLGARYRVQTVHAVDDVDLSIEPGEVLALVGESGCGKSTLGRIVAGILPPSSGSIAFRGRDVASLTGPDRMAWVRGVQMVFQDPMTSLNPRKSVYQIISEAPIYHGHVSRAEAPDLVAGLLSNVGLDPHFATRMPHELSGGQRQRVAIAQSLAVRPEVLVCDEATSALDVSIQAQILNMFLQLKDDFGLTYLFISHNLGAVRHVADRVVIMYLGQVVEVAPADPLFAAPRHPYTRALLLEAPRLERRRAFEPIRGEIPSPLNPPSGCYFHPRCPMATDRCRVEKPSLRPMGERRRSACHHAEDMSPVDASAATASMGAPE